MVQMNERPYEVCFSRNPVRYVFTTDTDLNTEGLRIDVRLYFREAHNAALSFVRIFELSLVPDSAGKADIDLSKVLDSLVSYKLPGITGNTVARAFSQCGNFYVDFREATTLDPDPAWTSDINDSRIVIKGGLPYEKWQGPNYFINQSGVLTWQKSGRYIGTTEKSWLTYLHLGTNNQADMEARVNVLYTDGTSTTNAVVMPFSEPVPKYGVYRIPVGSQLNLAALNPAKTIHYYTVRIAAAGVNLTVEYRFVIDYRGNYSKTTLYFFNSLGGFDSIRLLGELGREARYETQMAEKALRGNYYSTSEITTMQETSQVIEQLVYKGSVGLMDDEDAFDRLRDLRLSKQVQEIKFNRWSPVILLNGSIDLGNDTDPIKDFPVEYTPGFVNESYAPNINVGDLPSCPMVTNIVAASGGFITWTGDANHVQYAVELSDFFQEPYQVVYTNNTSYDFAQPGLVGFVRVKAICGFSETPWSDFVEIPI